MRVSLFCMTPRFSKYVRHFHTTDTGMCVCMMCCMEKWAVNPGRVAPGA
jgi:hypothetical protein